MSRRWYAATLAAGGWVIFLAVVWLTYGTTWAVGAGLPMALLLAWEVYDLTRPGPRP